MMSSSGLAARRGAVTGLVVGYVLGGWARTSFSRPGGGQNQKSEKSLR